MRTFLRYLRIAFSAVCAIACLLLIALWVRSYWRADDFMLRLPNSQPFVIHSMRGTTAWYHASGLPFSGNCAIESHSVELLTQGIELRPWLEELVDIQLVRRPVILPHWVFIFLFAAFSAAPWIHWRFGLRTLLSVITLIAVFLGWAVYTLKADPSAP
jgi:hypothetical protein